eukprot:TRINITY_DN13686_c0_g1_i1.p1 TRINITY_DN13686_c0_g1~~TRINITY_DN13686_c0_g1_i1.p1  ORF type:complete len:710 (-),score=223.53 TRINITY_DN13686_c0_g1_i1:9-2138(-)
MNGTGPFDVDAVAGGKAEDEEDVSELTMSEMRSEMRDESPAELAGAAEEVDGEGSPFRLDVHEEAREEEAAGVEKTAPTAAPSGESDEKDSKRTKRSKKKKKKKAKPKARRVYLDMIVVEAKDLHVPQPAPEGMWSAIGSLFTAKSTDVPDPYCCLSLGEHSFTTTVCYGDPLPVWNDNCTFTTTTHRSAREFVLLEVLDRTDRRWGSDTSIARLSIPVANVPYNELVDVWLDLYPATLFLGPPRPAPLSASSDPAASSSGTSASDASACSAASAAASTGTSTPVAAPANEPVLTVPMSSPQPTRADLSLSQPSLDAERTRVRPTARIHLMMQKMNSPHLGVLRHLGRPQKLIPLRMNVGDLILINSSAFLTHGVKWTTGSQWDHVAMVTQSRTSGKLSLFEATTDGVAQYTLSSALKVYRANSTIGVRRLKVERTPEMLKALEGFMTEVEGRPYTRSLTELIRAAYGTNESEDTNSLFCSQLVAKALQRIGVISETYLCNNILPGHFELPDLGAGVPQSVLGPINVVPQLPPSATDIANVASKGPLEEDRPSSSLLKRVRSIAIVNSLVQCDEQDRMYTEYILKVYGERDEHWTLYKRYSLFRKLHQELSAHFTGLAPLPPKTLSNRTKLSPETTRMRQCALEAYLTVLLESPLTRSCDELLLFLQPAADDSERAEDGAGGDDGVGSGDEGADESKESKGQEEASGEC